MLATLKVYQSGFPASKCVVVAFTVALIDIPPRFYRILTIKINVKCKDKDKCRSG